MKRLILTVIAALSFASSAAHAEDGVTVKTLLNTTQTIAGQPLTMPANPKLIVTDLTIAPGKSLPVHKHPYPRYAYILKGELDVTQVDGNKTSHLKTGDFFVESLGNWHFGTNTGKEPAELLVIDQTPQEATTNTEMKP
jgi:quercetin dioxygenase-like cupin family protein